MKKTQYTFAALLLVLFLAGCKQTKEPYSIEDTYIACGWMGCGAQDATTILFNHNYEEDVHSGTSSIQVKFGTCAQDGTGIYWVNNQGRSGCNWGDVPGEDFSTSGYTKLSFWAKGKTGYERIKFGIGGINDKTKLYQDSLEEFKFVNLTKDWKRYVIDISDKKLHSVIGGFYWYASFAENPRGGEFFLDDIQLE